MCIDPKCPTKANWGKKKEEKDNNVKVAEKAEGQTATKTEGTGKGAEV